MLVVCACVCVHDEVHSLADVQYGHLPVCMHLLCSLFLFAGPQDVTLVVGSHAVLSNRSPGPQVVRVPKEVPLNVTCLYSNDTFPPPVVFWYPDDSNVYGDGRTLLLHNPVRNASYHCVVENQVGNVSSVQVIVQPIGECRGGRYMHVMYTDSRSSCTYICT